MQKRAHDAARRLNRAPGEPILLREAEDVIRDFIRQDGWSGEDRRLIREVDDALAGGPDSDADELPYPLWASW